MILTSTVQTGKFCLRTDWGWWWRHTGGVVCIPHRELSMSKGRGSRRAWEGKARAAYAFTDNGSCLQAREEGLCSHCSPAFRSMDSTILGKGSDSYTYLLCFLGSFCFIDLGRNLFFPCFCFVLLKSFHFPYVEEVYIFQRVTI